MDDVEDILKLKARYFRTLDTKDWDGMRRVLADGYGHYHETYEKGPEGWRITTSTLTRLHADLETPEET